MQKLAPRLIILGVLILTFLGIFWLVKNSQNPAPAVTVDADGFVPTEKGKAIMVEFADFQCPACRYYYPIVRQLRADYGDKLTVIYKYFPLRQIHQNAQMSAQAGEAAKLQDKFNEMEEMLFMKQDEWANLSDSDAKEKFSSYAESIGLNREQFLKDISSDQVKDAVNKDYEQGIGLGVNSTPTFFVNGKKITNPASYDGFKSIIDQALAP